MRKDFYYFYIIMVLLFLSNFFLYIKVPTLTLQEYL